MRTKSLWPEGLFQAKLRAPVTILREQAEHLSVSSARELLGKVATERTGSRSYQQYSYTDEVVHTFEIEVPALDGYTYELFKVAHSPRSLYPVRVEYDEQELDLSGLEGVEIPDHNEIVAHNEDAFVSLLRSVFGSPRTIGVIQTLKAQSVDPDARPPAEPPAEPTNDTENDLGEPEDDDIPF